MEGAHELAEPHHPLADEGGHYQLTQHEVAARVAQRATDELLTRKEQGELASNVRADETVYYMLY